MNEEPLAALVERACGAFTLAFGRVATLAAAAPGRVNLIGDHTDYNAGLVLPLAIDRWCVCVGAPSLGGRTRLRAHDIDESVELSLRECAGRGAGAATTLPVWARYVVGALVERAKGVGLDAPPELDVLATTTVPIGSGLSSSAAVETACAVLVEAATGQVDATDPTQRAIDCRRAEHHWAGVPCGLMDQLASSSGRAGHALAIDCRDNIVRGVPLPERDRAELLVIDSGVRHDLADGEYAARRATCEALAASLGVRTLREIDAGWLPRIESLGNETTIRCGRHVVTEIDRVRRAVHALARDDLDALGELMFASHASLRDDFRVSCTELDAIVDLARSTPGVFGARMTGAGFGGCAIVLATPQGAATVQQQLPGVYAERTGRSCAVWSVRAVDGAQAVSLPTIA